VNRNVSVSLFKYKLVFLGAYFGLAIVLSILAAMTTKSLQLFGGFLVIPGAGWFALRSFVGDHGRGFDADERRSMLVNNMIQVAVLAFLGALVIKGVYDASLLNKLLHRTFPVWFVLFAPIGGALMTAPLLWLVYWWWNDANSPTPAATAYANAGGMARPATRMKVLLIGSGGREHALAWKLAQSRRVLEVLVAPGNAGTASEIKCRNVDVAATDLDGLLALAQREYVGLNVVGPEGPLVAGIVNRFRGAGLKIFGPSQAAAQLEGSKAFAKDFLARHKIPTAGYAVFTELEPALAHLRSGSIPVVVKADGLAAGKGVIVATTLAEAEAAVTDMLSGNAFGASGSRVVIEEFLDGEEASFISVVGGDIAVPMATSQDHKRVGDGDTGPNTGGMGAYSPAPVVTPDVHARVLREVVHPTVRGMAADGMPFTGFLYAGLMIDKSGAPKVIEFNVRFGDPETQPVMLRLKSDLLDLLEAAVDGNLQGLPVEWNPRPSLGVVMAAEGYPGTPRTGDPISGLDVAQPMGTKVFHAGTRLDKGQVLTSGGRVLCVAALGDTVAEAQRNAYHALEEIAWAGEFHRKDIGWRAIARERGVPA
jgi:phosphoribosylamine--glycine ligase